MKNKHGRLRNISSSWPIIVDEQTEQQIEHQENEKACNDDQLLQKDRKRHSIQCLYLDENEEHIKRIDTFTTNNHHQQLPPTTTNVVLFKNNLYKSESDLTEKISSSSTKQNIENDNNNKYLNEVQQNNEQNISLNRQKQQIEKLQRKCSRLEQLDSAYRKIECDYEQMLENEELSLISFYKLEHQFRLLDIENEQIRFEFNTNIGQNALFEEEKSYEEKIKVLENLTFNAQRQAKAAKERVHSFIFSQQQSSSSSSSVFGSILAASRIIGGELQKVGKIKAQEFLPVGTEELFNKFNKELDSFLIGTTEKSQQNNENQVNNEDLIFDKLNAGKTASKIVDFLDIRRSFNLFSNDFDQWSMSGTTTRGDQNKEMSLPTNMSDENREQLISLLGDEEERLDGGEDNFSGSKGEVRVLRQKIVQKRKIKRRQFTQRKSLVNEGKSQLFTFDLMRQQNEEFNLTKPISEEREQKIMKILNKIVHNEEENKEEEKCEELEMGKTEQIEKKKIKKEEENLIFEQNIFDNEEENVKEKMSSSLFEWTIEETDGEENVICDENFEKKITEEMEHFQETIAIPSIELSGLLGEIEISQPEESLLKMSSTTSSHSSTLSTKIKPTNPSILFKLIFQISDSSNWILLNIPFKIGHVGHCRHFLTICPKKKAFRPYYLMNNSLKSIQGKRYTPQWKQLRLHADGISIKDDGTRLWRIWNSAGFAPISKLDFIWPCSIFSKNSQWYQMTSRNEGNLLSVVLTSRHAWYLTDRGVFVQMFLPDSAAGIGYWYRTQENDEIDKFVQITASDDAVWVLNNFGMIAARVGLRRCPMGIDWAYLDSQPKKFVSISIYDKIGFGLDVQGVLWLIQGVALESPFGVGNWINCSPLQMNSILKIAPAPIAEWCLSVGSIGIFINIGTALLYLPEPFNEKEDNKEILLSRAKEMPERTLSGSSASSWCKLDG